MPTRKIRLTEPYPPGWEPFLASICSSPFDDLPRLVFADWLDENGDPPRAELIRIQCQLAHPGDGTIDVTALHNRAMEMIHIHWDRWTARMPRWVRIDRFRHTFERGFIGSFEMAGATFVRDGATIASLTPIENITLQNSTPRALASPTISRVGGLYVKPISSSRLESLARQPDLSLLRSLFLDASDGSRRGLDKTRDAIEEVLANSSLYNLLDLEVYGTPHGDAVVRAIASNPSIRLRRLSLYRSHLTADAFGELIRSPAARSLVGLYLAGNPLGDFAVRHLVESPYATQLAQLNLNSCELTNASADMIAAWSGLRSMRWMVLDRNLIDTSGVAMIRLSPYAVSLVDFGIRWSRLPEDNHAQNRP